MHYIGVDYHNRYSYIAVKDLEGRVERRGSVSNEKGEVQQFVAPCRPGRAVLEATRNWGVMYDWLEEVLDGVVLAHPLKVRAIAEARIKTDKISADILCDLLRTNLLPEAYVPGRETREAKNVLRHRLFFVRMQTMIKGRIHTIIDRHPEVAAQAPDVTDLFGATGTRWLRQVVLPGQDNRLLASAIELLEVVKQKISESNEIVKELALNDERVRLLRSIPGLGPFFSVVAANEIDNVARFSDEKKLCAYAGLVPSTHSSGGKTFHGRITKTGNKWLRWAFVEAVPPAIKHDADLFAYYQRLKVRKGNNAAKVATARRLMTVAYRVLKQERLYQRRERMPEKCSAPAVLAITLADSPQAD